MTSASPHWREAATVIITAPRGGPGIGVTSSLKTDDPADDSFQVLMMKREARASFFANAYVFPGGATHPADLSASWREIFQRIGGKSFDNLVENVRIPGPRLPMMRNTLPEDGIPREIGFRITAIREAFEESGVLLLTDLTRLNDDVSRLRHFPYEPAMAQVELQTWRHKVQADPAQFLTFCEKLKAIPNIWSLYEWCNWLTPVASRSTSPGKRPRRFDTLFYVCCLNQKPTYSEADLKETTIAEVSLRDTIF